MSHKTDEFSKGVSTNLSSSPHPESELLPPRDHWWSQGGLLYSDKFKYNNINSNPSFISYNIEEKNYLDTLRKQMLEETEHKWEEDYDKLLIETKKKIRQEKVN